MVDLTSRKLPLAIIVILIGVLVVQYVMNVPDQRLLIDLETCEVYTHDPAFGNEKLYTGELDPKCLELKELAP